MTDGQEPALYSEQALAGRQYAGFNPHALPKAEGFHHYGWLTAIVESAHCWPNVKAIETGMLSVHYQI